MPEERLHSLDIGGILVPGTIRSAERLVLGFAGCRRNPWLSWPPVIPILAEETTSLQNRSTRLRRCPNPQEASEPDNEIREIGDRVPGFQKRTIPMHIERILGSELAGRPPTGSRGFRLSPEVHRTLLRGKSNVPAFAGPGYIQAVERTAGKDLVAPRGRKDPRETIVAENNGPPPTQGPLSSNENSTNRTRKSSPHPDRNHRVLRDSGSASRCNAQKCPPSRAESASP